MKDTANIVGTIEWTRCTGGRLEPAERRRLIADLARVHLGNVAHDVAEQVGLSSRASETMQTAITMHGTPRVSLEDERSCCGAVAHSPPPSPSPLRGVNGPSRPGSG